MKLLRALGYEPSRDFHTSLREASSIVGVPYRIGHHVLREEVNQGRLSVFHPLPGLPRVLFSDLISWYETGGEKVNARPRKRENRCRPRAELLLPETDWWWRQRQMAFAYSCISHAIKIGLIERGQCIQCGNANPEAHHPDYSKPLLIIWLCKAHHMSYHATTRGMRLTNKNAAYMPSLDRYLHKLVSESIPEQIPAESAPPKKQPARRKFP